MQGMRVTARRVGNALEFSVVRLCALTRWRHRLCHMRGRATRLHVNPAAVNVGFLQQLLVLHAERDTVRETHGNDSCDAHRKSQMGHQGSFRPTWSHSPVRRISVNIVLHRWYCSRHSVRKARQLGGNTTFAACPHARHSCACFMPACISCSSTVAHGRCKPFFAVRESCYASPCSVLFWHPVHHAVDVPTGCFGE